MRNETKNRLVLRLIFVLGLVSITNVKICSSSSFFDYTLYAQLAHELGDSSLNAQSIFNYYNLNKDRIDNYNKYLYFPENERLRLKSLAKSMFEFGYDNYMKYAFPMDELDPIHCTGRGPDLKNLANINVNDALGDYLLTLVDSLSSLVVLGNSTEFVNAVNLVINNLNFNKNNTVQVFEATIR
jgi:hypothetical protein